MEMVGDLHVCVCVRSQIVVGSAAICQWYNHTRVLSCIAYVMVGMLLRCVNPAVCELKAELQQLSFFHISIGPAWLDVSCHI